MKLQADIFTASDRQHYSEHLECLLNRSFFSTSHIGLQLMLSHSEPQLTLSRRSSNGFSKHLLLNYNQHCRSVAVSRLGMVKGDVLHLQVWSVCAQAFVCTLLCLAFPKNAM